MNPDQPSTNAVPNPTAPPDGISPAPPEQVIAPAQITPEPVPSQPVLPQQPAPIPVVPQQAPPVMGQPMVPAGVALPPPLSEGSKKLRKKIVFIIVGIIVLMVAGVIGTILLLSAGTKYSQSDLKTASQSGVQFSYPAKWSTISWPGMQAAYGDGSDLEHSHAAVGINNEAAPATVPPFSSANQDDKKEFVNALETELKGQANSEAGKDGCKGDLSTVSSNTYIRDDIIGANVVMFCSKNKASQPAYILLSLGYGKDNKLHTLIITAIKPTWDSNESVFKAMEASLGIE